MSKGKGTRYEAISILDEAPHSGDSKEEPSLFHLARSLTHPLRPARGPVRAYVCYRERPEWGSHECRSEEGIFVDSLERLTSGKELPRTNELTRDRRKHPGLKGEGIWKRGWNPRVPAPKIRQVDFGNEMCWHRSGEREGGNC